MAWLPQDGGAATSSHDSHQDGGAATSLTVVIVNGGVGGDVEMEGNGVG